MIEDGISMLYKKRICEQEFTKTTSAKTGLLVTISMAFEGGVPSPLNSSSFPYC